MLNRNGGNWLDAIQKANNLDELLAIRESALSRLFAATAIPAPKQMSESLNDIYDALTSRTIKLSELHMERQGMGGPPVPYAYVLFGSGGRSEQTASSDQDSGIVYANPPFEEDAEVCRAYFLKLAKIAVQNLMRLGYPPCDGDVVSSNSDWCLSLAEWSAKIDRWVEEPSWEHVRYLLIVADGRTVAGDLKLANWMKNRFFTDTLQGPNIVRRMMENTLRYKVVVGFFGQLLPERYGEHAGSLDLKYGGYIPMVNVFRLMAIQAGIRETSTLARISALERAGILTTADAEQAETAFTLLLRLRLLNRSHIPKAQLTKEMTVQLKKALKFGREMQRRVERVLSDLHETGNGK